jgi:tight adherence protein C
VTPVVAVVVFLLVVGSLRPATPVGERRDLAYWDRTDPAARVTARWVLIAVATTVALTRIPVIGVIAVSVAVIRRARRGIRREQDRLKRVEKTLPEAIDLLALVVSAGVPPRGAMTMAAPRCPSPHREAWFDVIARVEAGQAFTDALETITATLGAPARPMVSALLAAERDGVALAPALDRCGAEAHRRRRVRAEEAARRVPVLMLFPLVCCVLPAFGLLTVVPLLAGSVADLRLPA